MKQTTQGKDNDIQWTILCKRIKKEHTWKDTEQLPPPMQIRKRKWTWIGHTLRKDPGTVTRLSLQ